MSDAGFDGASGPHGSRAAERDLQRLQRLADWMDKRHLDPLIGFLMPGAGDAIGAAIGLLGVISAYRLGAHPVLIARMLLNLALDSVLGAIPVLGALLDFFYRAHTRNLRLLQTRDARRARPLDWVLVVGAGLIFLVALCIPLIVLGAALTWLGSKLGALQ